MTNEQELCRKALDIQDAVNPTAVANTLLDGLRFLIDLDTFSRREHPAVRLIVSKLHDLCGLGLSNADVFTKAYSRCHELAYPTTFTEMKDATDVRPDENR
jgi:hypothetical protein